jgi:hypothetical protein
VASRHELRDELSAENACGAGYEDLHDCFSGLICSFWVLPGPGFATPRWSARYCLGRDAAVRPTSRETPARGPKLVRASSPAPCSFAAKAEAKRLRAFGLRNRRCQVRILTGASLQVPRRLTLRCRTAARNETTVKGGWPCGRNAQLQVRMPPTARPAPRGERRGLLVLPAGPVLCPYDVTPPAWWLRRNLLNAWRV